MCFKYSRFIFGGQRYKMAFLCHVTTFPALICAIDSKSAACKQTLDGALTQLNEHVWGKPTVDVLIVAKVFRVYTYSVVYQSGCDNLIFNSENDGRYTIIVAQNSYWLLCCGSCALPSVLLIKFLPTYYSEILDLFQPYFRIWKCIWLTN